MRTERASIKKQQIQLFCGKFTVTNKAEKAPEILEMLKKFERATDWTLTDARQNIQVYTNNPAVSLDTRESI